MLYEHVNSELLQALLQAGLEPLGFQEQLDTVDLTRHVRLTAILPGRESAPHASVESSYEWTAADTALSQGELGFDQPSPVVELTCQFEYYPLAEEYSLHVHDLPALRGFLRALVDKLPPALKDESGGNAAEARLLMGDSDEVLLYGPLSYQITQLIDLDAEDDYLEYEDDSGEELDDEELDDEDEAGYEDYDEELDEDASQVALQMALRDLATDALRGLMALESLAPPDGLFSALSDEHDYDAENGHHRHENGNGG